MVFPRLEVSSQLANFLYEKIKNFEDQDYLTAIDEICENQKDLFPGTNLLALILDQLKSVVCRKDNRQLLEAPQKKRRPCTVCNGTGLLTGYHENGLTTEFRCRCGNGNYPSYYPVWDNYVGWSLIPFPSEDKNEFH